MPAPEDLANGGNVGRLWDKIDNICTDITTIKTDVAFIKGKMAGGAVQSAASNKMKATILGSLITGLFGVIIAFISFFRS